MPKESFDKLAKMREKALEAGGEARIQEDMKSLDLSLPYNHPPN